MEDEAKQCDCGPECKCDSEECTCGTEGCGCGETCECGCAHKPDEEAADTME